MIWIIPSILGSGSTGLQSLMLEWCCSHSAMRWLGAIEPLQ